MKKAGPEHRDPPSLLTPAMPLLPKKRQPKPLRFIPFSLDILLRHESIQRPRGMNLRPRRACDDPGAYTGASRLFRVPAALLTGEGSLKTEGGIPSSYAPTCTV